MMGARVLPEGWRWVRLGEVCGVFGGSTPDTSNPDFWDGDIVWITPADLGKSSSRTIASSGRRITPAGLEGCATVMLPVGTVVLSSRAPIGHLGIAEVPLCTNQGCKSFVPGEGVDSEFLYWSLKHAVPAIRALGSGATFTEVSKSDLERFQIPLPPLAEQQRIAAELRGQMEAVARARAAAVAQVAAVEEIPFALVRETLKRADLRTYAMSECLSEIKTGVGPRWGQYPLLGATREGLAPAKEAVGKAPERYKLVDPVTVFYNPMRILLGSIALVDDDDATGITSPDYVVVKGCPGILDTRWFYYWFRSPLGAHLIDALSRGAVRERILFSRLSDGVIELPPYEEQVRASEQMKLARPALRQIRAQLAAIHALPAALLRRAFGGAQ